MGIQGVLSPHSLYSEAETLSSISGYITVLKVLNSYRFVVPKMFIMEVKCLPHHGSQCLVLISNSKFWLLSSPLQYLTQNLIILFFIL